MAVLSDELKKRRDELAKSFDHLIQPGFKVGFEHGVAEMQAQNDSLTAELAKWKTRDSVRLWTENESLKEDLQRVINQREAAIKREIELQAQNDELKKERDSLKAALDVAVKALEFYALEDNYQLARQALARIKELMK